jgi:hypothetical protein
MIAKFSNFDENRSDNHILFYAFDWDDNILNMPTVIHMDEYIDGTWVPKDVSTNEFAEVRTMEKYRIINDDPEEAFSEFRDTGPRGLNAFLEDVKLAISREKFGPAWDDFIECLVNGSLFAIITARGHEGKAIGKAIEFIIDDVLSKEQQNLMYTNLLNFEKIFDKDVHDLPKGLEGLPSKNEVFHRYISHCDLIGVSAPSRGGDASSPEEEKEKALLEFKTKVNRWAGRIGVPAKIGFSDDDSGNITRIEDLIKNLDHEEFSHIKEFVIKDTGDPENIKKTVKKVESNANVGVGGTPGLQSSTLGFKNFGNLSDNMFRDNDASNSNSILRRSSEELAKVSKELLDEESDEVIIKKKKKKKKKKVMERITNFKKFNEEISKKKLSEIAEESKKDPLTKEDLLDAKNESVDSK